MRRVSRSASPLYIHCLPELLTRLGGLSKGAPLPTRAVHTHYWLTLQSCLFQLAAPVTAHLVSPGGSMKWKFMFKFKNNILTLGASDVYIFNNLLRMKAWVSMCVASCLPAFKGSCVLCGVCLHGCGHLWTCLPVLMSICVCQEGIPSVFSLEFRSKSWLSFRVWKS